MMSRPRVLVTRAILEEPLQPLREVADVIVASDEEVLSAERLQEMVHGCDALICHLTDQIDGALLKTAGPRLKIVANYAVGYNNIDLDACRQRGVWATNTPGVLTDATADIAFTLLLSAGRRVLEGDRLVRSGRWQGWAPQQLLGADLAGQTLGIVGCGRIGQAMARRAAGFDMERIYWQPNPLPPEIEAAQELLYVDFATLLNTSDFISLHCPLTPATHHLIDAEALCQMKSSAILINTSRGPVVDEEVLVEALKVGQIAGAGLDVYEEEPRIHPELAALENVVLLPHLGSATHRTRSRMGEVAVANVLAALAGETPSNDLTQKS